MLALLRRTSCQQNDNSAHRRAPDSAGRESLNTFFSICSRSCCLLHTSQIFGVACAKIWLRFMTSSHHSDGASTRNDYHRRTLTCEVENIRGYFRQARLGKFDFGTMLLVDNFERECFASSLCRHATLSTKG